MQIHILTEITVKTHVHNNAIHLFAIFRFQNYTTYFQHNIPILSHFSILIIFYNVGNDVLHTRDSIHFSQQS